MPVSLKFLLLIAIIPVATGSTALAQVPPPSPLDRILPAVSTPSPANLRDAESAFKTLEPGAADVLTQYGMALALAANNRHPQAFDLVESIPSEVRKGGPFRRLRVWLAVKLKKDELAQLAIQELLDELRTRSTQEPTAKDLEDVQFAGKLVQYLLDIAEREEPLHPAQAKTWRQALDALPAAWKQDLPAIETTFVATRDKRLAEAQASFAGWRAQTEQTLVTAQQKLAGLAQDEAAAKANLTKAQNDHNAFLLVARPQLQMLEGQRDQLQRERSAIRKPLEPREPREDKKGKISSADERKYDREKDEYERELRVYNDKVGKLNSQLNGVNNKLAALHQQDGLLQKDVNTKKMAHQRTQTPLQIAVKNEARIKEVLAERPAWDSPISLAPVRALDGYLSLDGAREVARIQASRKR